MLKYGHQIVQYLPEFRFIQLPVDVVVSSAPQFGHYGIAYSVTLIGVLRISSKPPLRVSLSRWTMTAHPSISWLRALIRLHGVQSSRSFFLLLSLLY